jgi:hypothetical protein
MEEFCKRIYYEQFYGFGRRVTVVYNEFGEKV